MPPYPLTSSKDMLSLDDVNSSNKRQNLEENSSSVDGISNIFSCKQTEANELPNYEWAFSEEFINFQVGIDEIPTVDSTENKDAIFINYADIFGFQEVPSVENTEYSRDLIDNDSSLEIAKETPDSSKGMLPLDDANSSNKRQKLEQNYLPLDGNLSVFSCKEIDADELPSYERTFPEEFINFQMGIEGTPAVGSTENKDAVFIIDADVCGFQETPSVENTEHSKDLIDNSSLEIVKELPNSASLKESTDAEEDILWLDYVAQYDADGELCRKVEIPTRKLAIMEELQMISETVRQMKEDAQKQEELSSHKHQKKVVQKMKVDCPNCQKTVAAVRFVPHLSKCFGYGGRKCTRQKQSP